jgi:hypothetical protein
MLWTGFKLFIVLWMLQMIFQFGTSVLLLMLVVSLGVLVPRLIIRRAHLNSDGLHCAAYNQFTRHGSGASGAIMQRIEAQDENGSFNSAKVEQFAGDSKPTRRFTDHGAGERVRAFTLVQFGRSVQN